MFMSLMTLMLERLLAIKLPFKHRQLERKHIVGTVLVSWLPSVVLFTFWIIKGPSPYFKDHTVINAVCIAVAWTVSLVSNTFVYRIAVGHDRFMKINAAKQQTNEGVKTLKASYVCLATVSTFVLLWLPYLVFYLLALINIDLLMHLQEISHVVEFIAQLNSIADPISFIWLSKETKKEFRMVIRSIYERESSASNSRSVEMSTLPL